MELVIFGLAALFGGFLLGAKMSAKAVAPALNEVANTQAIDRANYLQTLRRELANILIWHDPQRYLALYRQLHAEVTSLRSWRLDEVRKRLLELCKKYPNYSDFDAISTREYVLYSEGAPMMSMEDLEKHYRDLIMFAALSVIADDTWKDAARRMSVHLTSDNELDHLTQYVQRIEDTKLRLRIERAMDMYHSRASRPGEPYDNDWYSFRALQHFAENRYAIHLKLTNEFAIYSFFVFDDGRILQTYFRSDPTFQRETMLDPLTEVLREFKRPLHEPQR